MTTRCKAGDMAIIVHDEKGRDVGVIVDVLKSAPCDEFGANWWIERCDRGLLWCYLRLPLGIDVPWLSRRVICADAWLKPIRGLPTTDTVKREQEATA